MIDREAFLEKYQISDALFKSSGMSWDELCCIYKDFSTKREKYEKILAEFLDEYLESGGLIKNNINIHSVRARVKDSEHLIEKIIRKKQENQKKYQQLNKDNYEKFLTDLIGIRCLIRFKEDWLNFHHYLLSKFENKEENYVRNPLEDFDENEKHNYIAERPKVHIRNGDRREIYEKELKPDSILDGKVYRSVHYIIKYDGIYLEIQVRTIFEEAWSEIDHEIVYPYYRDDETLEEYTELLNRLTGLADEMGSFFESVKKLEVEVLSKRLDTEKRPDKQNGNQGEALTENKEMAELPEQDLQRARTPAECLKDVMNE